MTGNSSATHTTIPFFKRLVSYIYPLTLRRSAGSSNQYLELILYCDRLQLTTKDALYSDGDKYVPATVAVKQLKQFLPSVNKVLVLGSGLGSIVRVIHRAGFHPSFTLVEQDSTVLKWAMEFFGAEDNITPLCMDAAGFMKSNNAKFDLVFIDIFTDLNVPDFVGTQEFLQQCKAALSANGHIAFNYISHDPLKWESVKTNFLQLFPAGKITSVGINEILVC